MTQLPPSVPMPSSRLRNRATDKPASNPEALAKQAIRLLEKRIAERFQLDIHLGAELECSYRLPEPLERELQSVTPSYYPVPGGFRSDILQGGKKDHYQPGAETPKNAQHLLHYRTETADGHRAEQSLSVSDNFFPDSPRISHSYRESSETADGWYAYEHVISHKGAHAEIPMGEGRALAFARAIEVQRRASASTPAARTSFAKDPVHNAWISKLAHGVTERSTRALVPPIEAEQGMHFNFSFSRRGTFGPQPEDLFWDYDRAETATDSLRHVFNAGEYLLLPSLDASARGLNHCTDFLFPRTSYFEMSKPSSESNPYYTTLLALVATYRMLDGMGYDPATRRFAPENRVTCDRTDIYEEGPPDTPEALLEESRERFFTADNPVCKVLNELEPTLGDRFAEAVKRMPPGQEKPAHEAGITGPVSR